MKVVYATGMDFLMDENILIPEEFFKENGIPFARNKRGMAIPETRDKTDYHADQRLAKFIEERGEFDEYDKTYSFEVGEDWFCSATLNVQDVPEGCYYRISLGMDCGDGDQKWETLDIFDPRNLDGWKLAK